MDDKTRDDLALALARWITEGGPEAYAALVEAKERAMELIEATDRSEC